MEIDMKDRSFPTIWAQAARAINRANRYQYFVETDTYAYGPHKWWLSITHAFDLHPVVAHIVGTEMIRPIDWQLLMLEWPHVSTDDDSQIAYTRNEAAGRDFIDNGSHRQTRTSIGKYLARHWPHVPDHVRRDWAGRHAASVCEIWDTKEGIISGVELGPRSCMKSTYGSIPFSTSDSAMIVQYRAGNCESNDVPWHYHPYSVYDPALGWRMAVRLEKGKPDLVLGRALVHTEQKTFVRSYLRGETESSTSYTDEKLEAWLREQGYNKADGWVFGTKFAKVEHPNQGGYMMPYIDGGYRNCEDDGNYIVLVSRGGYCCDNTDGTFDNREAMGECEDCGETVYEEDDDRIWTGRHEDRLIGGACGCANNYRWAEGYRGEYYVHEDDVIVVGRTNYDSRSLPECIRELHDGEYAHEDDCVYIENCDAYYLYDDCVRCETDDDYYVNDDDEIVEIDGKYYRKDDDEVVKCADDEYRMRDECWQCAYSEEWYPDEDDCVEVAEGKYHPDSLREMADNA